MSTLCPRMKTGVIGVPVLLRSTTRCVEVQVVQLTPCDKVVHHSPVFSLITLADTSNNSRVIRKLLKMARLCLVAWSPWYRGWRGKETGQSLVGPWCCWPLHLTHSAACALTVVGPWGNQQYRTHRGVPPASPLACHPVEQAWWYQKKIFADNSSYSSTTQVSIHPFTSTFLHCCQTLSCEAPPAHQEEYHRIQQLT